jgi:ABC-type polysaccharide/polyol phosphate transport system ATPase subunit
MPVPAVTFDQVWKKFSRGERRPGLRRRSTQTDPPGTTALASAEFWALRDVSFTVSAGEALGIIGPNGAGKSTSLKLLTKILRPTHGQCSVRGRVGALIEVAAGFHGDLTGRENVFLQGAIMGMRRVDIALKLESIIEFSGLQEFIDTPVKRYSSGMNARLGFSIAANLDPDVLIIDEVLAVGDMVFQQRCIDRMREFRQRGVAIVFVSHNLEAVSSLCQRAIFLSGETKAEGKTDDVIHAYVNSAMTPSTPDSAASVDIKSVALFTRDRQPLAAAVPPGTSLICQATFVSHADVREEIVLDFVAYRSTDNLLTYQVSFALDELGLGTLVTGTPSTIECVFDANLTRGHYHVVVRVRNGVTGQTLSGSCPPAGFAVTELRTWAGIADLEVDVKPDLIGNPGT